MIDEDQALSSVMEKWSEDVVHGIKARTHRESKMLHRTIKYAYMHVTE